MKALLTISILIFLFQNSMGQISSDLQALSEGETQLRLSSNDGSEFFNLRVNNDGILRFLANNSDEVMQIDDDNENVAIGTSAHVSIKLYSVMSENSSSTRYGIWSEANGSGTGTRYGVRGHATGNTGNRYGVFGAAAIGNGRWGVYCSGNLWYTGSVTSVSDARFKSEIKTMDHALSRILKLRPTSYKFKQDVKGLDLPKGSHQGFIAQEMEKIFPGLVETNMHDILDETPRENNEQIEIKGINYVGLIPVLTKAIQEQQEEIEALKKRIALLEN